MAAVGARASEDGGDSMLGVRLARAGHAKDVFAPAVWTGGEGVDAVVAKLRKWFVIEVAATTKTEGAATGDTRAP